MALRERAENTFHTIAGILGTAPTGEQEIEIVEVIEQAIIKAVLEERERCVKVADKCCSPDRDRAHKIAAEIRRAEGALIANLQSLR